MTDQYRDLPLMNAAEMSTFQAFVHDDRYSVPTLHLLAAADEVRARAAAQGLLRSSAHHLGVELCRNGVQIAQFGSCQERRLA